MSRWWVRADVRRPPPRAAGRRLSEPEQVLSVVAHLSPLPVAGLGLALIGRPVVWLALALPLGPAVMLLATRRAPQRVRIQVTEALNFNLTIAAGAVLAGGGLSVIGRASWSMQLLGVFLLLLLVVFVNWLVLMTLAAVEAGRGAPFGYPAIVRVVPGPSGRTEADGGTARH